MTHGDASRDVKKGDENKMAPVTMTLPPFAAFIAAAASADAAAAATAAAAFSLFSRFRVVLFVSLLSQPMRVFLCVSVVAVFVSINSTVFVYIEILYERVRFKRCPCGFCLFCFF